MAHALCLRFDFTVLIALAALMAGCRSPSSRSSNANHITSRPPVPSEQTAAVQSNSTTSNPIHLAGFAPPDLPETIPLPSADSTVELSLEQLVADVLARNPNLQAMTATWQAATWRVSPGDRARRSDVQFDDGTEVI